MITRRIQTAIRSALRDYRLMDGQVSYNPLAEALAHMNKGGDYGGSWTPSSSTGLSRVYAEMPPDNLRSYPLIVLHNSNHARASWTHDTTVYDSNGANPEVYPGHTCWLSAWVVYSLDESDSPARCERVRELIDSAMEKAIGTDSLNFSLDGESEPAHARTKPYPPKVNLLCFRRSGLTLPYDEWYDGRRYWWRGIKYEVELEEVAPVHSSLR